MRFDKLVQTKTAKELKLKSFGYIYIQIKK